MNRAWKPPRYGRRRLAAELRGIRESKGKSGDTVGRGAEVVAVEDQPVRAGQDRACGPGRSSGCSNYYEITGPRPASCCSDSPRTQRRKAGGKNTPTSLSEDYKQFIGLEHEATIHGHLAC